MALEYHVQPMFTILMKIFIFSVGTITISIAVSLRTEEIRATNKFLDFNFTTTTRIIVYFLVSMIAIYEFITTLTFGYKFWETMSRKHRSTTSKWYLKNYPEAGCCGVYSPKELLFDGIVENFCEKAEFQTILFSKWRQSNIQNLDQKLELFAPSFCCQHPKMKIEDEKLHDPCSIDPVAVGQTHTDATLDPLKHLPKIYSVG
uniref:Tetraspanin 6 n=1 Tax=Panagrolaimus sp. ES5 TaxID=591445 RepID=A0AC34FCC8_9BILA